MRALARLQTLADRLRLGQPTGDAQRRVLAGFAADWLAASRPLQACRAALLLHAAAGKLAVRDTFAPAAADEAAYDVGYERYLRMYRQFAPLFQHGKEA